MMRDVEDDEDDGNDVDDDPMAAFQRELTTAIEEQRRQREEEEGDEEQPVESFVDDDGTTYDWDAKLGRFTERGSAPTAAAPTTTTSYDESMMTYDASVVHGADEKEVREATETFDALNAEAVAEERGKEDRKRARQREHAIEKARAKAKKAKEAKEAAANDVDAMKTSFAKNNTAVYVTGLPKDVSEEELHEAFKKCGVVKLDASTGGPRVKVYRDEDGNVKGDGLVVFLKAPSVDLAITLLDQTELRFGDASTKLSVSAAKFDAKSAKESGDGDGGTRTQQSTGTGTGTGAPRKKMTKDERRRAAAMLKKQEQQALGWSGLDDAVVEKKVIVVLKHMFTLEEMYADVNLRGELEEDVMDEAKKCGEVLSIKTYTTTKDGVMTLRFRTIADAKTCISQWNGRWFDGRQIVASLWDGKSKFVESNAESEEAQKARLDAYAAELGGSDDDEEDEDEEEDDDEEET